MANNFSVVSAIYDGSSPLAPNPSLNDPFVTFSGTVNGERVYFGKAFRWSQIQLAYAANGFTGVQQLIQAAMLDCYYGLTNPVEQGPPYAPGPQVPIVVIPAPVTGGASSVTCTQAMCGNWRA